ncbi:MAG: hypothetical protein K2O03_15800, partial [Lachnospiraceae bacterium]|nr:hypothetical protein [Lachnospiraceae bacterium]
FEGSRDSAGEIQPINYGSAIILTGIHTSGTNVKTVNASMVAGRENHVSGVEFVGITKEFSSKIEQELPADFSNGDYLLLFNMLDILGYSMDYSDVEALNLNFISIDPFMLGAFDTEISNKGFVEGGVTIDGETYGAIRLTRGINTSKGGTGKVQVTSTKVGQSTMIEFRIVAIQVLNTFQMYTPDEVIAEGDGTIAIPFEAFDTEGQPITSYRALCNALTFSDKALKIYENNDGSAWLRYEIPTHAGASKYVDATRIYTSTVIKTGNVSTLTLTIKDEAVPASVKAFDGGVKTAAVEGYVQDVNAYGWTGLTWYDQYDREIPDWRINDSLNDNYSNRFYGNYAAVKYNKDSASVKLESSLDLSSQKNYDSNYIYFDNTHPLTIKFSDSCTLEVLQETLEFALAEPDGKIVGGSDKKLGMKIADLSKCVTLNFGTWGGKLKVNSNQSGYTNSDMDTGFWMNGILSDGTEVAIPETNQAGYAYVEYSVDYNNRSLKPLVVSGSAIQSRWPVSPSLIGTIGLPVTVTSSAITMNGTKAVDFDVTSPLFTDQSKRLPDGTFAHRFLEATGVAKFYTLEPDGEGNFISALKDVCKTNLYVGIQDRRAASFVTKWWVNDKNEATIKATAGKITYADLIDAIDKYVDNYDNDNHAVTRSTGVQITISKLTESINGVHFGSTVNVDDANKQLDMGTMSIVTNNTTAPGAIMIQNAEIGDTFVATYEYEDAVLAITFTVGADKTAFFNLATDETTWR